MPWKLGLGQIIGVIGSLLISLNLWANSWPSEADKRRLAKEYHIPRSYWDLPLPQQVSSSILRKFYNPPDYPSPFGRFIAQRMMAEQDRYAMAVYLAKRIQEPFYDPHSPLYRQAIVTLKTMPSHYDAQPLVVFTSNPSLAAAEQGPFAQFLAYLEEKFGDRLIVAIAPLKAMDMSYSGAFYGVTVSRQVMFYEGQVGWVNIGLVTIGRWWNAASLAEILQDSTLAHELWHAQMADLQRAGLASYNLGRIEARNNAAMRHHYDGRFSLHEISAHFLSIRGELRDIAEYLQQKAQQAWPRRILGYLPAGYRRWKAWWGEINREDLSQRRLRLHTRFNHSRDFLDLTLAVLKQTITQLQKAIPDPAHHHWASYEHGPLENRNSIPYWPSVGGIEVHLKLPNASKDVSPNHKHHNSSAESFSYKIPYNVLRAVYDTHAGDASPADRLKEFRVYNELYLKNSAVKRSDFDPASYQRVCQKIYNHDAFVDLLYFLQRQYAYWSKIGKLFQEVDFQWQAIEGHSARFTLANINSMQEDLQKLLTVLQEDDLHYPWLEKEGTMMKNCAGWLVPGGGR